MISRTDWSFCGSPVAWGFVRYLAEAQKSKPLALSNTLEEMRRTRDEKNRESTGPTTWKRIEGWTMSAEDQEKALVTTFGKDVFKKATAALRSLRDIHGSAPEDSKAKAKSDRK